MGFAKREQIEFLNERVELASEENCARDSKIYDLEEDIQNTVCRAVILTTLCRKGIKSNMETRNCRVRSHFPDRQERRVHYKYCEEEWELYNVGGFIKEISLYMNQYAEENDERFTDPETFEYLEAFDEHCDKMITTCKKSMERFKQTINKDFPDLLLTFNIGEYLDNEERTEFFAMVNTKEASEEYAEHIDDFN